MVQVRALIREEVRMWMRFRSRAMVLPVWSVYWNGGSGWEVRTRLPEKVVHVTRVAIGLQPSQQTIFKSMLWNLKFRVRDRNEWLSAHNVISIKRFTCFRCFLKQLISTTSVSIDEHGGTLNFTTTSWELIISCKGFWWIIKPIYKIRESGICRSSRMWNSGVSPLWILRISSIMYFIKKFSWESSVALSTAGDRRW